MKPQPHREILDQGLEAMGLALGREARGRLVTYCEELLRWNAKINLVAKAPLAEIWETHFLDSLTLLRALPEAGQPTLLDIGTGAGFPGLAVKAARPELPVILVEPREKRVSFLKHVIRTLGLAGVTVLRGRLEAGSDLVAGNRIHAEWITSRAFTDIAGFLRHCEAVSPQGGKVICMKGPRAEEELAAWRAAQPQSPYRLIETIGLTLPFSGNLRRLLIFGKEEATP
ncbi:MAG: 16S rRNA (guanine(527)-N(7))-methyltransferase RsmG [Thermodesulfobacteriota bacterium]